MRLFQLGARELELGSPAQNGEVFTLGTRHYCLKGLCQGCLFPFVNSANYGSLFAMKLEKLLANDQLQLRVKQRIILSVTNNKQREL